MVDTIVLRVHDLRKHAQLEKIINRDFTSKGELRSMEVNKQELENYSEAFRANDTLMIDYFRTAKIGTHRLKYKNLKRLNNSGNYYLNAFINKERDFIELSFSVPKYIFGTNVLQFVHHPWDKSFAFHQNSSLKYNMSTSFARLSSFIRIFFKSEFPEEPVIDFRDVEVNRLDLCFNQVFHSKEHALEFLEMQKTLQRKHTRTNSNKYREYESSFMYVTDRYSLKVYHKGYEYAKNDKNEHFKINELRRKDIFDIKELQSFSDKMLRYEVTLRKSMLSYLYNQHIFRQRCPEHKALFRTYKEVEKINAANDRISDRYAKIKRDKLKERYLHNNPYLKINPADKKVHRYMTRIINKSKTFMLSIDKSVNRYNHVTDKYGHYEQRALFSKNLFELCGKFFLDFVNEFQVEEKPSIYAVAELIDNHNAIRASKLPKNGMLQFFKLLEYQTFDDIKKSGIYSKPTYYRYKKRFSEIGITQTNLAPSCMVQANADLRDYHTRLMMGKPLVMRNG